MERKSQIIEQSENDQLETILFIRTSRGDEVRVNADRLARRLAEIVADDANDRFHGIGSTSGSEAGNFKKLRKMAALEYDSNRDRPTTPENLDD